MTNADMAYVAPRGSLDDEKDASEGGRLRVAPTLFGLRISCVVLKYLRFTASSWNTIATTLPPKMRLQGCQRRSANLRQ